ncbi:MAG: tyrosine-type recombinase/integrase [Pseudomonadota bacterium]
MASASIQTDKRTGASKVSWRDPDGRQRSKRFPKGQRRAAEVFRAEIVQRLAQGLAGRSARQDPLPAEDAVAAYIDHVQVTGSADSARTLESTLSAFVAWWTRGGTRRAYMTDLDPIIVERWFKHLCEKGSPAQPTRVKYARRVSSWWAWTARRYRERCAPHTPPDLPRAMRTPKPAPTWAEMDRCVLAAAEGAGLRYGSPDAAWVERAATIARYTGLRPVQVWALTWDDIDLVDKKLTVAAEHDRGRRGRIIPICDPLVDYLATLGRREGGLFDMKRCSLGTRYINRCWRASGARSTISGWHAFRRGFETGLLAAGVDLVRVRALVGHSSGVDDHYIDAAGLDLREAVARIPKITAEHKQAVDLDARRTGG